VPAPAAVAVVPQAVPASPPAEPTPTTAVEETDEPAPAMDGKDRKPKKRDRD
jgi:Meckel syndrome type 1 protein